MANDILGSELNIDGLIEAADKAQKAMDKVAESAEGAGKRISDVFKSISTQGIDNTLQKLYDLKATYETISKVEVKDAGLKEIATNAKTALDEVNKLIEGLYKAYGAKAPTSTTAEQKAEENRYNEWLRQKYEEEQIHKQIEDRKTQATRSAIAEQNKLFAEQAQKRQEGLTSNQSVKDSASKARQEYEQTLRMYDAMFAEIERREIESNAKRAAEAKRTTDAKIAEYERLMREERRLKADYKIASKASQDGLDYNNSKQATANELNKVMRERESLEIELGEKVSAIRQKYRAKDLKAELDAIEKARKAREAKAKAEAQRSQGKINQYISENKAYNKTYEGALKFSDSAKTINRRIIAIKNLKDARNSLTTADAQYESKLKALNEAIRKHEVAIAKATGKTDELKKKHNSLLNTTDQLTRKLALMFSVSAIQGYVQKLASVRAEFELQQRSLQAILQNKEKADELWGQTVQLALKSPFRVKELVSYTKQLAAYRIETDKLHETTKRLADVSAGLGVDMQRLILAYGQVRAAEYLRGTELRQFTEAGIPMLDELAKYFTEMEGRTVTTAEVFERISKRMVEFGDVAEVFNRITSAGGVFYEMQEKQADTLHGQISNLHDAIDLMLNDIGAANDGMMKGLVSTARAVVDNWEEVWLRMQAVLLALAAFGAKSLFVKFLATETGKAAAAAYSSTAAYSSWGGVLQGMGAKISTLSLRLKSFFAQIRAGGASVLATATNVKSLGNILSGALLKGLNVARAGFAALKVAMSSFLPMLAITALVELYFQLTEASREAERLKEALSGVDAELGKDLEKSISTYERLARTISDGTKSYTERDEAMQELKRTFSDILPSMYLERDTILEMAGNYDKATSALRVYYDEKARIQKLEKLDEHYQDSFSTDMKESWRIYINKGIGGIQEDEYLKILSSVIEKGKEAAKNGILWDKETLQKELADALQQFYGFNDAIRKSLERNLDADLISHNLGDLIDLLVKYQKDYSTISGLPATTKAEKKQSEALSKMRKEYDEYKKTLAEINSLYGKYANLQKKSRQTGEKINDQDVKDIEKELKEKYEKLKVEIPVSFSDVSDNTLAMQKEIDRVTTSMNTNFVNTMSGFGDKIKIATGGIYTMNTALAGMSKTPMPPMLSNINILNTDVNNLTQGINKTGTAVDFLNTIGKPKFFTFLPNAVTDINNVEGATAKLAETVISESDKVVDNTYQNFVNNIVESVAKANGVQMNMLNDLVVGANATSASVKQTWKNQYDELVARHTMAKQILAENPLLTVNYVYSLTGIEAKSEEELKKIIKSYEESWKKVGFDIKDLVPEKKKQKGKKSDPAKDFANMLKEIRDSYEDLNDWMDKNDAITRTTTNWRKVFEDAAKGVKGLNLAWEDFDFTTVEGLVSALEKLQKVAKTKKTKDDIGKTIGQETTKQDEKTAKKRADARDKEIDQLFELYDLYKELDKLDFPKELAQALFGIDATSLNEIRSELEQNSYRFVGEEGEKKYQEYLDKITELENKEQIERLKTYTKYLVEGMNERVKIKLEELNKIAEVESMAQYSDSEKKRIKESIQKETKEKLDKQTWEDFTQSDMYIQIFQDLDNTSDAVIKAMLNRLQSLKESLKDLSPDKVKDIVKEMDKLSDELNERKNPFELITSNLKTYINYLKNKNELEKRYTRSQDNISSLENERDAQADKVAKLKQEYKTIVSIEGTNSTNAKQLKIQLDVAENILDVTLKRLVAEGKISQELADQIRNGKTAGKTVSSSISNLASNTREVHSAFTSITDSIQNIFGEFDEQTKDVLDSIGQVMGGVATMEEGISSIMEGKVFTGVLNIFSGLGQTIAGFFGFGNGDKKKERQIQKETELVEKLERAYEKLEKAIDAAYSFDTYSAASKNAETNIKQRIEANKRMIQLEKDKKGTDEERIKEWEEQNKDLEEQLADLYVQRFTDATDGILDDTRSAAREFVDAWLDAWLELGNGMSGLEESFNEMLKNMLKQQATMLIAGGYLENWKKDLEKYINPNDLELTTDEARKWVSKVTSDLPKLNDSLTAYFEALKKAGIDLTTTQGSELSGLQEGIQGVTEETAQIIEAYLNSIRFYIAQDNQNLADLRNFFIGSEDNVNPMLAQLKIIATQTTAINSLLESLTAPHPTQSGRGLKVII